MTDKDTIKDSGEICPTLLLQQYKDIVDKSVIVSKTDPNGVITYVNKKFCTISGYKKEELLGNHHNIVRHPQMDKKVFKDLWKTIKIQKKTWSGKVKNLKKDGSTYWVKAVINPILDEDGNILEYIALRTEITKQEEAKSYFQKLYHNTSKKFTDAVNLSKQYHKAINNSTILSRTDPKGNYTYVNDKFLKISGYSWDKLIGKHWDILSHPDMPKDETKRLWKSVQSGTTYHGILKKINKKGNPYWVDCTVIPIVVDNKIVEYMFISHSLTEVFDLHQEIKDTQREIIYKLGEICESRSKETSHHVKKVALYSKLLADLSGMSEEESNILYAASPMHDIGKIAIPDNILHKNDKLTDEEHTIMKQHCLTGKNLLKGSNKSILKAAEIIAFEHHEKWDGSGYPQGLKGDNIHIYGRITAIADVFDALGSSRCYKKAWELEKILELFQKERGKHFDPRLTDLFFQNLDQFLAIKDKFVD